MTLPTAMGIAFSTMPPCCICGTRSFWFIRGRGFVCRLATFRPWTTTRYGVPVLSGRSTRSTTPRLPASLPPSTRIVSPLRISETFVTRGATARAISEHLRRERDDLHVVPIAQLARHGAEDPCPARVALVVDEDGSVLVEADVAAVGSAVFLGGADHHGTDHVALLDGRVRDRLLHAGDDHVTDFRGRRARTAHDPDALDHAGARVVRDPEPGLLLDHASVPSPVPACALPGCAAAWIASVVADSSTTRSDGWSSPVREMTSTSRQRFVRDSGRASSMRTVSPTRAALSSSCAANLLEARITRL